MQNPFDHKNNNLQQQLLPGIYTDLTNEQYHSSEGISKTGLDLIAKSPSIFQWAKSAPVNHEKTEALDFGTALHSFLLEPDTFKQQYITMPSFNLRSAAGKQDKASFLASAGIDGKVVLAEEDMQKLLFMYDSVYAHPTARMLFELPGLNEASIYWNDQETGELCRIRPDRMVEVNGQPVIVDVKKIDGMERFRKHVLEFRYHVQEAMYQDGHLAHFGVKPLFWFLAVSSTISAGRYPVSVFQLSPELSKQGYELYRRDLRTYHQCKSQDQWLHIQPIQ